MNADPVEFTIRGDVQAMHLEPGDDVIITVDRRLTREQAEHIKEAAESTWPGHRVLVLADGISLSVSRPATEGAGKPQEAGARSDSP